MLFRSAVGRRRWQLRRLLKDNWSNRLPPSDSRIAVIGRSGSAILSRWTIAANLRPARAARQQRSHQRTMRSTRHTAQPPRSFAPSHSDRSPLFLRPATLRRAQGLTKNASANFSPLNDEQRENVTVLPPVRSCVPRADSCLYGGTSGRKLAPAHHRATPTPPSAAALARARQSSRPPRLWPTGRRESAGGRRASIHDGNAGTEPSHRSSRPPGDVRRKTSSSKRLRRA